MMYFARSFVCRHITVHDTHPHKYSWWCASSALTLEKKGGATSWARKLQVPPAGEFVEVEELLWPAASAAAASAAAFSTWRIWITWRRSESLSIFAFRFSLERRFLRS